MNFKTVFCAFAAMLLAGCFTVGETEYPQLVQTSLPKGRDLPVQLAGFEASITSYIPVYGYETVLAPAPGPRHRRHLYATTIATETYIPQVNNTTAFLDRAADTLEKCGFTLQTTCPQYRVEVKFSGPFISGAENAASLAWTLFTLFTTDYGVQTWTARMKIYDNATGKVCLFRDYTQKYEAYVWGPLPIFSPAGSDKCSYNVMQSWCLTALTDRAMADATAFLSTAPVYAAPAPAPAAGAPVAQPQTKPAAAQGAK